MGKSQDRGTELTTQLLLLDCAGQGHYLCCDAPARQARQIKIEYATPGAAFFFPTGRIERRFFALALGISVFALGNVWWGFFGVWQAECAEPQLPERSILEGLCGAAMGMHQSGARVSRWAMCINEL